jgi:acyl carrier protein
MDGATAILTFFKDRPGHNIVTPDTVLTDALDSLAFIDLFLYLEDLKGCSISLDEVVACQTVGELSRLVEVGMEGA